MKKLFKQAMAILLVFTILHGTFTIGIGNIQAEATTLDDINQTSVFIKQGTTGSSGTCTLASAVMMVRRAAIASGNSNWSSITESAMKPTAWKTGAGLYYNFTYAGISVKHASLPGGSSNTSALINLLSNHPEGVMIYDRGIPHAILLTDYTDGVFYCADPSPSYPSGRINISQASVKISNADEYWYVSSPKIILTENNPSNVWVSIPNGADSSYKINTPFDITFGADNASEYTIYIYNGESLYWSGTYSSSNGLCSTSVCFQKTGYYSCYIEAKNSAGKSANSSWIGWYIEDTPSNVWISLPNGPESSYKIHDTFYISLGADNAVQYTVHMYKGQDYYWGDTFYSNAGSVIFDAYFSATGHYSCYVEAKNSLGESSVSQWIGWDIVDTAPTNLSISVDKVSDYYTINDSIIFTLSAQNGYYKHIGIHKVGDSLYLESDVIGESYSINITEPGYYYADFDAYNACGTTRSDKIYFRVVDSVPEYANIEIKGGNKNYYLVGDTISFDISTQNASSKYVGIHKDGEYYDGGYISETTIVYSYVFSEPGSYLVNFDALNPYGYTRSNEVTFEIKKKEYTLTYNANGGTSAPSSQTKTHDVSLTLTNSVPTKKYTITYNANGGSVSPSSKTLNCKFVKWNTAANGSGTSYNSGATYLANNSVTLYAQYATPTAGTLATPTRSGYTFDGWYTAANGGTKITASTVISKNTTVYAHWTKNATPTTKPTETTKPTQPTTKPSEPTTKPSAPTTKPVTPPVTEAKATVEIRTPSTTTISYGDSIILHADVENLPAGAKIVWEADNGNFTYTASADGTTCTISPSASGNTTFTATVCDATGNEIASDDQTMTAKAGFFQKLIAFFKKLFGMTKVIPEAFKNIFLISVKSFETKLSFNFKKALDKRARINI